MLHREARAQRALTSLKMAQLRFFDFQQKVFVHVLAAANEAASIYQQAAPI